MNTPTISLRTKTPAIYQPVYATPMTVFNRETPPVSKESPGSFALALAHEIRNPLTNINLSLEMLESVLKDKELGGYLDIIKRSSIRINNLVNELLKYRAAEKAPDKAFSIQQLLDEVLEGAGDRIQCKKVSVNRDYAARDYQIEMDRPKMKIALTNIVMNAIESMPPGKGKLKLTILSLGDRCMIRIEDNGCGISKTNMKNIFKPYFTNKPGGMGLGLSTTYDILASNHVGVHVESEEGLGTSFALSL